MTTVLMLTSEFPPYRGGVSTYAVELARATAALGFDVTIAAPDYHADQSELDSSFPFRVIRFAGGANRGKDIFSKTLWTIQLSKKERFDFVHAIDWPFFIPLASSRYRRESRCLLTFHGTEINMMYRRARRIILSALRFWNGWAICVANSHYTADHLQRMFPMLSNAKVRAIPLGVRPPVETERLDRATARRHLKLSDSDLLMLSLGRIVERKGLHVTVEALSLLRPPVREQLIWYVVGPENDAEYSTQVKQAASELGMRINFTGPLPGTDVETVLSASDFFCLPAIWGRDGKFEGFGLVYLEAGLRGSPSIGTELGGIPDAVIDGVTGLLVPPSDATALAEAITRIVEEPALRERLAAGALSHAQASTWENVAAATYAD